MNTQFTRKDYSAPSLDPQNVLADWLSAIAVFQVSYQRVSNYVTMNCHQPNLPVYAAGYLGQCSTGQLMTLLATMQEALKNLQLDMDQFSQLDQSTAESKFKRLATHTATLERLNQQAKTLLHLALLPAS